GGRGARGDGGRPGIFGAGDAARRRRARDVSWRPDRAVEESVGAGGWGLAEGTGGLADLGTRPVKPRHFKSAADFREWLASNGPRARELWVGFYKKASGKGGLTYKEAVDEALCHGWIDGIKKRVDEDSYTHRFTPRTATSIWSVVNLKRMKELLAGGRVAAAGRDVYERRDPK